MKKVIMSLTLLCAVSFAQETLTDSRDKQKYKTVAIGKQIWMAENLRFNAKDSKCHDNKPASCTKYGRVYKWETAKNACPADWHLPSSEEWKILINYAGGEQIAGKKLKAKNGWLFDVKKQETRLSNHTKSKEKELQEYMQLESTDEFGFSVIAIPTEVIREVPFWTASESCNGNGLGEHDFVKFTSVGNYVYSPYCEEDVEEEVDGSGDGEEYGNGRSYEPLLFVRCVKD